MSDTPYCKHCGRGTPYDWSPGDVIHAERDGTIVLDDGITTYNPTRAVEWLLAHDPPGTTPTLERLRRSSLNAVTAIRQKQQAVRWRG